MSKWLKHKIGEGVVLTRQATSLRDGELQAAAYCRMQPGDREQLYPDKAYSYWQLNYGSKFTVVDMHYMTFENGEERWIIIVDRDAADSVVVDQGWIDEYDPNDLQTTSNNTRLVPNKRTRLWWTPTDSSLTNVGAEYHLGVAGTDPSKTAADPNRKVGERLIYYIDDQGQLARREVGFAPTTLEVTAEQALPQLGENYLQLPNSFQPRPNLKNLLEPNWKTLVERDLYGSNSAYLTEFDTAEKRREIEDLFYDVTDGGRNSDISHFVPIKSVKLSVPGNGYVFAYWVTEYDSEFDVESAASTITSVANADPIGATWEVTLDWLKFFQGWADNVDDLTGVFREYVWTKSGSLEEVGVILTNYITATLLRYKIESGAYPEQQVISLPLSAAQREGVQNVLTVRGNFANARADEVRLYRQNLGFFSDYLVSYPASDAGSPSPPEPQGEGLRNAEDLREGRISRQGGLLTELTRTEIPADYEDYLKDSGATDPAFAYPTVNYVTRGGLGVYEYLRRPVEWAVGANMGQTLLRVPWSPDLDSNQIAVSPSENPEQQPLIWHIPVVTEQQDTVKAIRTIRDQAIVLTRGSCFRLNYIPFEGSNQADRVLTQVSGTHGVRDQRRALSLATGRGQMVVFLSESGLMGTNGRGLYDMCPDFSIYEAEQRGYTFDWVELVNNPKEHRIEMWADGVRWDFLYHASHLKDIRGDGYGLVFKLMGPTRWYDADATVRGTCTAHRPNNEVVTYHIVQDGTGGHRLGVSTDNVLDDRLISFTTRKMWGSNPKSRLRAKAVGLQHDESTDQMSYILGNTPVDEVGGSAEQKPLKRDVIDGFSESFVEDGLGSSHVFIVSWANGAVGPLWTLHAEAPGAASS